MKKKPVKKRRTLTHAEQLRGVTNTVKLLSARLDRLEDQTREWDDRAVWDAIKRHEESHHGALMVEVKLPEQEKP